MRRVGFLLGLLLALAAAATLVAQLLSLLAHGAYVPVSALAIWQAVDPQGADEVALAPPSLLGSALAWLLRLPAFVLLGVPAVLLLALGRPRRGGFG